MLTKSLEHDGQVVHNSTGDADTMIVVCTIQFAREGRETTVVADDTDILVILMYHWRQDMADVYFRSETNRSQQSLTMWKVRDLTSKADSKGHIVTQEGISTEPSKVEAAILWPTPMNKMRFKTISRTVLALS